MSSKALAKRLDKIEQQTKQQGHGFVVVRYVTDENHRVLSAVFGSPEKHLIDRNEREALDDFEKRVEGLLRASESASNIIGYGYGEMH